MDGRAGALASAEALRDLALLDEEFALLAAVTPADVRSVAERYLSPEGVGAVAYLPEGRGADLDAAGLTAAFQVSTPRREPTAAEPDPAVPPVNGRPSGARRGGVLHVELAGADLLLRHKGGVPTVTLGVYAARGDAERPVEAGLGALTLRSAIRGQAATTRSSSRSPSNASVVASGPRAPPTGRG